MADFNSVLAEAQKLPGDDVIRLIDALWDSLPDDANFPLHEDWGPEIERRVAEIQSGTAKLIPWETVRAAALARINDGQNR